jgi:hypothetical protein
MSDDFRALSECRRGRKRSAAPNSSANFVCYSNKWQEQAQTYNDAGVAKVRI